MKEPEWLTESDVLAMHDKLLARFGGLAGVRDPGLLDSALNRPKQLFHYEERPIFDLAAAYAEGIVKNHPFLDGNKRTGFVAAGIFLLSNGYRLTAPEEEAVLHTLALAASQTGLAEYSAWLEKSSEPRE